MTCTSCKAVVQVNATGTCLGCQQGFNKFIKDDHYKEVDENLKPKEKRDNCGIITKKEENEIIRLEERKKELEDALQEPTAKEVPVQPKARSRKGVRGGNTKGKKAPEKSKEEGKVND